MITQKILGISKSILITATIIVTTLFDAITPAWGQAQNNRADTIVLVNTMSASYQDFVRYIKPYLDHFGVPYTILDIATQPILTTIADYSLIIVGHNQLDIQGTYLDNTEQQNITNTVNQGTGLVNFDSVLADGNNTPYYQYIQNIFSF